MKRTRGGFTLLEVILTLSISAMLIAAIGSAIHMHLRLVDAGRTEVEQAQLARTLLRRIADDLRSAMPIVIETSGVSTGSATASIAAASGISSSGGTSSGGTTSGGSSSGGSSSSNSSASVQNITGSTGVTDIGGTSSGSSSTGSSSTSSGSSSSSSGRSGSSSVSSTGGGSTGSMSGGSQSGSSSGSSSGGSSSGGSSSGSGTSSGQSGGSGDEGTEAPPPRFYGTQTNLEIDIVRATNFSIPAASGMTIDPTGAMTAAPQSPDDAKSVSYYVSTPTAATPTDPFAATAGAGAMQSATALMRSEMPRSAAALASSTGGLDTSVYQRELAREVTGLEFRYYDGTEWVTEWDSESRQAVPVCVEIALTMRAPDTAGAGDPFALFGATAAPTDRTYRLLVHLPAGEPSTAEASTSTESTSSTETSP